MYHFTTKLCLVLGSSMIYVGAGYFEDIDMEVWKDSKFRKVDVKSVKLTINLA